jgi:hypothetical protein
VVVYLPVDGEDKISIRAYKRLLAGFGIDNSKTFVTYSKMLILVKS